MELFIFLGDGEGPLLGGFDPKLAVGISSFWMPLPLPGYSVTLTGDCVDFDLAELWGSVCV